MSTLDASNTNDPGGGGASDVDGVSFLSDVPSGLTVLLKEKEGMVSKHA